MPDTPFIRHSRHDTEQWEHEHLAPAATLSSKSAGRRRHELADPDRTVFERDRDRVLHSKAFRRLKHKTQVFMNPEGDHYVTRLTHALKVTQIGRSIARMLSLNETLTEAMCLAHDVGHSPFGHTGEEALSEFVGGKWLHAEQSVRIFEVLEPLNLTAEVLDGIGTHSWKIPTPPATTEGHVLRYADRIAYLAHDAEDGLRAGALRTHEIPRAAIAAFGQPGRQWIGSMINAVVDTSLASGELGMDQERLEVMNQLRDFMFEHVYLSAAMEPLRHRAKTVVRQLVEYYLAHGDEIPETYRHADADLLTQVIDYVAGMTDRFAVREHKRIFEPRLF